MNATATTIKPRKVRFDWSATPLHWVPGEPQTTHTMNVLHLLLPAGEKWFAHVYRQALPLITDDVLREQAKGFMGQESVHSRAHQAVLEHLKAQGLDPTPYTRVVDFGFEKLLGDHPLGIRGPARLQRFWLLRRLAIIAAVEHFTAVLGTWIIEGSGALDDAGADPVMLDLLRWHGAEEVEHRSVAFDVADHLGVSRLSKTSAMVVSYAAMFVAWVAGVVFFMRADPLRPGRSSWRRFRQAGRRGLLPTFESINAAVPRYLKAGYHPSQEGDTERARAYLATSPAVA